ncbi:hypothetical protein D3C87_1660570 [compost metagenome]
MTISPFNPPQARPTQSTAMTPNAVSAGVPTTSHDARAFVRIKIIPTERSMPAVITTSVWAMATKASKAPLLAAVCTTFTVNPAGWFDT